MKTRLLKAWIWCKENIFKKDIIVWIIIAELIFWSPVIVCSLLALANPWWWTAVGLIITFWAGPFTPAVPLQMGLAIGLRKIYNKLKNKQKESNYENNLRNKKD